MLSERDAIHAWIREDLPLAAKMVLLPAHADALIARLDAARSEADERVEGLVRASNGALAVLDSFSVPDNDVEFSDVREALRSALKSMEDSRPVSGSVPSPVGEGEWRPIESALKDGETEILASTTGKVWFQCCWDEDDQCWVTFNRYLEDDLQRPFLPAIWMPVPEPSSPSSQPSEILPGEGE